MYYYSPSLNGFFSLAIHHQLPDDAVPISDEEHRELLDGQVTGLRIGPGADGRPILVNQCPPSAEQLATARNIARRAAYQAEADPLFFKAQRGESTLADWESKIAEIRARYPE